MLDASKLKDGTLVIVDGQRYVALGMVVCVNKFKREHVVKVQCYVRLEDEPAPASHITVNEDQMIVYDGGLLPWEQDEFIRTYGPLATEKT